VDSRSFEPAIYALWKSPLRDRVAGFASINYRLSPYPLHPRLPSSPDDPSRNVHYPCSVMDIAAALLYLEENVKIANRYILIGHSAGATMAFQVSNAYMPDGPLPKPAIVLGISGIYNLEAFVESHKDIPAYRELTENAFPKRDEWERASPSSSHRSESAIWEDAKVVIISHSKEDELVEDEQASYMLEHARMLPHMKEKVHFLEATGAHDEIWESGHILAGLITKSLEILESTSRKQ
jgi:kynurenine formamidase